MDVFSQRETAVVCSSLPLSSAPSPAPEIKADFIRQLGHSEWRWCAHLISPACPPKEAEMPSVCAASAARLLSPNPLARAGRES